MIRTEISGAEIAEEMEKERRLFQLQMCEVRWPRGHRAALAFPAHELPPSGRPSGLLSVHQQAASENSRCPVGLPVSNFCYRERLSLLGAGDRCI